MPTRARFPQTGLPPPALFELMEEARSRDVDWRRGRVALYVHYAGEDVLAVAKAAYQPLFRERPWPQGVSEPAKVRGRHCRLDWDLCDDARGFDGGRGGVACLAVREDCGT